MRVLIATPAFGRDVTVDYLLSIRDLEASFRREGIESDVNFTIGSVLPRARAALASRILVDDRYSHLLFVDSDMQFRPEAVGKLVRSRKAFCGCLYPVRMFDHAKLHEASRVIEDRTAARNAGQTYVCLDNLVTEQRDGATHLVSDAGLVQTESLGFGLTLIDRSVLSRLRDACPELVVRGGADPAYRGMGITYDVLQAFESVQADNGLFLGEDLSFSHRWRHRCGGDIWACIDEEIGHVGTNRFVGRPSDALARAGIVWPRDQAVS